MITAVVVRGACRDVLCADTAVLLLVQRNLLLLLLRLQTCRTERLMALKHL
jgi:hypothetical protein